MQKLSKYKLQRESNMVDGQTDAPAAGDECVHDERDRQTHTNTHTRLMALFPGLPGWAGTRKVKPIWILLK